MLRRVNCHEQIDKWRKSKRTSHKPKTVTSAITSTTKCGFPDNSAPKKKAKTECYDAHRALSKAYLLYGTLQTTI